MLEVTRKCDGHLLTYDIGHAHLRRSPTVQLSPGPLQLCCCCRATNPPLSARSHLNYDQLLSRCNTPTQRGHTATSSMDTSCAVVQALESVKDMRRLLLIVIISSFSFLCFSHTADVPRPRGSCCGERASCYLPVLEHSNGYDGVNERNGALAMEYSDRK